MILKELYTNADMKAWKFAPKVKHDTEFKICKITYSDGTIRYRPYYLNIINFFGIVWNKSWYGFREDTYSSYLEFSTPEEVECFFERLRYYAKVEIKKEEI